MENIAKFTWKFQRLGGLDQVTLRTTEELRHLAELDPKLWAVLSCPAAGLEFDSRTLELIDTDKDGRIRIPEVLAAVDWVCSCLEDPSAIAEPAHELPLTAIKGDTEQGARLLATGRAILQNLGKAKAGGLTQEDVTQAAAFAAKTTYNGDGILPPLEELGTEVRQYISDALAVMGGVTDANGQPGINREIGEAFLRSLMEWLHWKQAVSDAATPLGADTPKAWELLEQLKDKIDDYFLRCELASFAPGSTPVLNAEDSLSTEGEHGLLDMERLEELPLARVEPDRPLRLASGLNPAWRERMERFFALVRPLLNAPEELSKPDWQKVRGSFEPYAQALAQRPALVPVETGVAPTSSIEALGVGRVREIIDSGVSAKFAELADKDANAPAASADIAAMERLVLYYLHLHRLLMNFVSFYDFYSLRNSATFQAGTLYLDGRSCRLCLPVTDQGKHSALAAFSHLCLVYCDCRRKIKKGSSEEERAMSIVAAVTAGDADLLLEGRNGVFVDTLGQDWDASLTKIVSNPISLWQALWEPYKKFGRMLTEQIAKFAGAKQEQLTGAAAKKLDSATAAVSAPPAAAPAAGGFDIGRSVGIFAAIGLALGALGTALASIANALFALSWWQFPLVILGLFLIISGPSLIMAWLKLRKRTLGPLLEASGWAVNSRIAINFTLGSALTSTAALPKNATRSYKDPLKKPRLWPWVLFGMAVIAGAAAAVWLWFHWGSLNLPFFKPPA